MMVADAIVAAVREKGSDPRDVRDAAHEAAHAFQTKLQGKWERERIHQALQRKAKAMGPLSRAEFVRYEVQARAVEQLVCQRLEIPYEPEKWRNTAWMETLKNGINVPTDFFNEAIERALLSRQVAQLVKQVMRLANRPRR